MTAVSAAVVAIVVATNTASPWSSAPVAPTSFKVALGSLAGVGAENRYLARIGARVRVVPLESRCTPAGRGGRSPTPQSSSHRTSGPWIGSVIARQAPSGAKTIVLASQGGLDAATFQVRGRAPACLPAIAAVRYW